MIGITKSGKQANSEFCLQTGFIEATSSHPQGDAWNKLQNEEVWVEIKKDTYNQVRPYKYNVLVGYDSSKDEWYVIPADEVITEFSFGKRGQHTTDPVEVLNLGKVNSKRLKMYQVEKQNLRAAVISAYLQSQKNVVVKEYASERRAEYENTPVTRKKEIQLLREKLNAQITK